MPVPLPYVTPGESVSHFTEGGLDRPIFPTSTAPEEFPSILRLFVGGIPNVSHQIVPFRTKCVRHMKSFWEQKNINAFYNASKSMRDYIWRSFQSCAQPTPYLYIATQYHSPLQE